jgi:hypothetical protein
MSTDLALDLLVGRGAVIEVDLEDHAVVRWAWRGPNHHGSFRAAEKKQEMERRTAARASRWRGQRNQSVTIRAAMASTPPPGAARPGTP